MIDIPETHTCVRQQCVCKASPTVLRSCKFIVPARSPGEPVERDQMKHQQRRQDVEEAAQKVAKALQVYKLACEALWGSPLDARCRREQAKAFSELGQAQFELSEAFTYVPPKS